MTDFIKQAREYFEQNPDKSEFYLQDTNAPHGFRMITRKFIKTCDLISRRTEMESKWNWPLIKSLSNLENLTETNPDRE